MGLIEPLMVKTENVLTTASMEIEAEADESLLIKRVAEQPAEDILYTTLKTRKTSVGYFYNGAVNANHLEAWCLGMTNGNIIDQMIAKGMMVGYPVAEGEKFSVSNPHAGTNQIQAFYETYEAGDMLKEMPNGSKADEYDFVNYGTNTSAMTASAFGEATESRNPTEFPAFPFGEDVPAKTEIELWAFLVLNYDPTGAVATTRDEVRFLRLTREREVLWDKDLQGIYLTQGMTQESWGCGRQAPVQKVNWFPKPLVFGPGEELKAEVSCGATLIAAKELDIAFITKVRKVA